MKYYLPLFFGILLFNLSVTSQTDKITEKQIQYLSGTDNEHTETWEFYCTGGRKSGYWTTIEVPSCWEQQGFGTYNFGRDYYTYGDDFIYADEEGIYKYKFHVPMEWHEMEIFLVFEGSMTDTEVKINNRSVGEIHQGSFYRFKYDVTELLVAGLMNDLEVKVSKMSANQWVNRAERYADYWIFGGIYRPVYLEAVPKEHIGQVAVSGTADGKVSLHIEPQNIENSDIIYGSILSPSGKKIVGFSLPVNKNDKVITHNVKISNPQLWSCETPTLYSVVLELQEGNQVLYRTKETFGFRTIEVKEGDGIYINGKKMKFKGVNRHVFWPETGRTVNREIDRRDVLLIKEMNMNAVRCSHYPPDQSFLQLCDSLGLYVIDELAGWHDAYDTEVGHKLVKEMVTRDVNHPSIILWSNGNEGGHNKNLVADYALYDPSGRPVIHAHHKPNNAINGIDCNHYESYESCQQILADSLIYMTTEFLHCQNDGGGGAALHDYWELMYSSLKSAGGFLWALLDEGLVRTDYNNIIDVNGVNAPDGVLGPHREKEGSFNAIKEIFSPVKIDVNKVEPTFNGNIEVENRFDFTNLNTCTFQWKLVEFNLPSYYEPGFKTIKEGTIKGPECMPGNKGSLNLKLPETWNSADAIILKALSPKGMEIYTWTIKIKSSKEIIQPLISIETKADIIKKETDTSIIFENDKLTAVFGKNDGQLIEVKYNGKHSIAFKNGPVICNGHAKLFSYQATQVEDKYVFEAKYSKGFDYVKWTMHPNGWLQLDYKYQIKGDYNYAGISFSFPEDFIFYAKWLGNGPYRVWKNRLQGTTYNVWQNAYNNTTTGGSPWTYPEFKGYFSNISWMELNTAEGKILIATPEENFYIRLFDFQGLPGVEPHPVLPPGDISFLDAIPAIGTKMSTHINAKPELLGPESQINHLDNTFENTIYFYFGNPVFEPIVE
ncbi:MAG: hypothetical protein JXB49_02940 [Bacteroidales bacterium]|nr:hypothetical protein [Bacteroidales bacterium]